MDELRDPEELQTDDVVVRAMHEADLDAVVNIDAAATGFRRPDYFKLMIQRALKHATMQISLVAEIDGGPVGFLIGSLYYGEFGQLEPAATIDAVGVDDRYRKRGVAHGLVAQLRRNLGALRISTLRTEVAWDDFELLGFFKAEGFTPAQRLCLEMDLDPTRPVERS